MNDEEVKITNYEDSDHRDERLNRVYGYVCALADHFGNKNLLTKISGLHDHKGFLEMHHQLELTNGEKEWFKKAWSSEVGHEPEDNVEFHFSNA